MKEKGLKLDLLKTDNDILEALEVLDILLRNTDISEYGKWFPKNKEMEHICIDTHLDDNKVLLSGWLNTANCCYRSCEPYEEIIKVYKFAKKHNYPKFIRTEEDEKKGWNALKNVVGKLAKEIKK